MLFLRGRYLCTVAAIVMAAFCCSIGNAQTAQVIYSNSFNGGATTINGTAPTMANSIGGGDSAAQWIFTATNASLDGGWLADGEIGTNAGSALLPFTPQAGAIYYLTASVTLPAGMANWIGLGFAESAPQTNPGHARFADAPVTGFSWLILNSSSAPEQFFGGGRAALETDSGNLISAAGTYNLEIVLDTHGNLWTTTAYINGVQVGDTIVYDTNPSIHYVGLTQQGFTPVAGIQWRDWSLSGVLPTNYWVAPAAAGAGDGSSAANAAAYRDYASFWSLVKSQLNSRSVNVNFLDGNYGAGSLALTNTGNPLHRLTLQAVNRSAPVFKPSSNDILEMDSDQNITVDGFVFTGQTPYWGMLCQPTGIKPTRNITISNCRFLDLTNAYYAGIGLLNGTRDIIVNNCAFTNVGAGAEAHMIYASHDIMDVQVLNSSFTDCRADYVRFRDDSDYCIVSNCAFHSTQSATSFPFITSPLFNSANPGVEFFGTHFQVTSNSFTYDVSSGTRAALQFSDSGYDPQSYHCALTSAEANLLNSGTTSAKQSFLQTNMGIVASGIKMFGNTFNSRVTYQTAYTYTTGSSGATGNGWTGTCNISDVPDASGALLTFPKLRNANFDWQGLLESPISSNQKDYQCLFRAWLCSPKYTDILSHPGFDGTTNAMRFDAAKSQYIYQWISSPTPNWTLDFLFAIGSGFTGSGVKFKVDLFHNDISGGKVSIGVNNSGQFGIYNGGTFTALPELGTVAFSTDNNGNGLFTDAGDTLNVYHLRVVGNYSAATPYVDLYASDANNPALTHQSLGEKLWVSGAPVSGQSAPGTIAFYNYTAPVMLDQISLIDGIPPVVTGVTLSNGNFILTGTNGSAGIAYCILSSTNLVNWTRTATNTFTGNAFSVTNVIAPGQSSQFYRLQLQSQ